MRQTASSTCFLRGRNLAWSDVLPGKKVKTDGRRGVTGALVQQYVQDLRSALNAKGYRAEGVASALSVDVDYVRSLLRGGCDCPIQSIKRLTSAVLQLASVTTSSTHVSDDVLRGKLAKARAMDRDTTSETEREQAKAARAARRLERKTSDARVRDFSAMAAERERPDELKRKALARQVADDAEISRAAALHVISCNPTRISQEDTSKNLNQTVVYAAEKGFHMCEISSVVAAYGLAKMSNGKTQTYWDRVMNLFMEGPTRSQFVIEHPGVLPQRA